MFSYSEKVDIIDKAFKALIKYSSVTLNRANYTHDSKNTEDIFVTLHYWDKNKQAQKETWSLEPFWFDKKEWAENEASWFVEIKQMVDEMVPASYVNAKSEEAVAIARITAALYNDFKNYGWLK